MPVSSVPNHGTVKETPTRAYRSTPAAKQIKTEIRIAANCVAKVLYCIFFQHFKDGFAVLDKCLDRDGKHKDQNNCLHMYTSV